MAVAQVTSDINKYLAVMFVDMVSKQKITDERRSHEGFCFFAGASMLAAAFGRTDIATEISHFASGKIKLEGYAAIEQRAQNKIVV